MPSLKKLLSKLNKEERIAIKFLLTKIISLDWQNLDIKKLKGHQDIFRVRKGKLRIIFSKNMVEIYILSIDCRSDTTYNF